MEIVKIQYPHSFNQQDMPESVLAIGYFDGVHQGHQEVIQNAIDIAEDTGRESAVMTFHPHPSVVLKRKTQHVDYITPVQDKMDILENMGVDRVYLIKFNKDLASLLPQEFVDHFLIGLNVKHVVAGFDFSYGRMGRGTMDSLPFHSRGNFSHTVIDKVTKEGTKVSSTLIRDRIHEGQVELIKPLLGRPYSIQGKVVQGDRRGNTIGFPTANIELSDDYLVPKVGVYAVRINIHDEMFEGMANIGYKPTFQEKTDTPSIEVNIFDYNGDLYGEHLKVEWHRFIRNETKFNGVEELVSQLKQDEMVVRDFFIHN